MTAEPGHEADGAGTSAVRPVVGIAGPRRPLPGRDVGADPELAALLRDEIQRSGPITFARFMQRALYEPRLGYYSTDSERQTRAGDFVTAPELHPIFGHALARQLHEMWQRLGGPGRFTLREYGAGSGALALSLLEGLVEMRSPLANRLRYQPIEVADRADDIAARLEEAGHGEVLDRRADGEPMAGCVLANEFLDALPVHRVVQRADGLRELFVDWAASTFVEVEGPPSTPELADWFESRGIDLAEGRVAEVNLALIAWVRDIGRALGRGYVLVIDYGAEPSALYGTSRPAGTLRAFRGQHVSSDLLAGVGRQDLTAHVDLGALEGAAAAVGLAILGRTSQAEFLIGCGLEEIFAAEQARLPDEWQPRLLLRSVVKRLLDPRHLGGYAVEVFGRDVPMVPPLSGLSFRLPTRP